MVYLHKEIFLVGSYSYSKLSKGKIGPYRIINKIEENMLIWLICKAYRDGFNI